MHGHAHPKHALAEQLCFHLVPYAPAAALWKLTAHYQDPGYYP